jgi:beta-glucanase (GH16 family)
VFLGVDSKTVNTAGRNSVRMGSHKLYTHGLFIADIAHMPDSTCGVWSAFWTTANAGQSWPAGGEIDIIEGVSNQTGNVETLHTAPGCTLVSTGLNTTTQSSVDCNTDSGSTGCSVKVEDPYSFGTGFNSQGGGIYAMEWTSTHISIWNFPRSSIPVDIIAGTPNPTNWPTPASNFGK